MHPHICSMAMNLLWLMMIQRRRRKFCGLRRREEQPENFRKLWNSLSWVARNRWFDFGWTSSLCSPHWAVGCTKLQMQHANYSYEFECSSKCNLEFWKQILWAWKQPGCQRKKVLLSSIANLDNKIIRSLEILAITELPNLNEDQNCMRIGNFG